MKASFQADATNSASGGFVEKALFSVLFMLFMVWPALAQDIGEPRHVDFSHFGADLPSGWDGDEQSGFISGNPAEYALTLGHKDEDEDSFDAQVTVYLLPNKPGATAESAARTLAESQADPGQPCQKGNFWVFEGEPRSNTVKGRGITMVNADPEFLLIIIAQDPANYGGMRIVESLTGRTPEAKKMLGR